MLFVSIFENYISSEFDVFDLILLELVNSRIGLDWIGCAFACNLFFLFGFFQTKLTIFSGREETGFSDGDVLIFPEMVKYR